MSVRKRYIAAMVLSGVGDAMGYQWEFEYVGEAIHAEVRKLGGVQKLHLTKEEYPVSDDTVLHLATAEALASGKPVGEDLFMQLSQEYIRGWRDMSGRAPGATTGRGIRHMEDNVTYIIPFDKRGGGCGAAMRSMCIGLRYPKAEQLDDLIAVAIESGRMTHNAPTGFLGSVAGALFTSYAVQGKKVAEWGKGLMEVLPKCMAYVEKVGRDIEENKKNWAYFTDSWTKYLTERGILNGGTPIFPDKYGVNERDEFYKSVSWSGWGGASGHDAPMIAYDALLASGDSWEKLCLHGVLHGGDCDSTGVMCACWWGYLHGLENVPRCNYKDLEYHERLESAAKKLYELSHGDS